MPSLLSFIDRLFASKEPLTIYDDYVDETLSRPNPFAADPMIRAESHHHIVEIYDFMRHDHHLNPWLLRESHEQVLNDPRFSLNSILITYP